MRGKQTPELLCRAVEILSSSFSAGEISLVVNLPRRSVYSIIEKARLRNERLEAERKEQERLIWANIQQQSTLSQKPVTTFSPIRRIHNDG
jgi:hypothetical protein